MKPPRFDYVRPESLEEALAARGEHADDCSVLAGGQSLIPLLSMRLSHPELLIDLGRIDELVGVREHGGGLAIGTMTRQRFAERSALVAKRSPLIVQALRHVAHPTIRNRGTVGGSVAHADPAAELPAVLVALDAELVARSSRGQRVVAAADFFQGFLMTALEPEELLTEIRLPGLAQYSGSAFVELARRHGDFALVGVAACVVRGEGGSIGHARLVFTGVDQTPVRVPEAEALLCEAEPSEAAFAEAAARAASSLTPGSDLHASANYRRRVAGVLARRALHEASAVIDQGRP